MHVAVDQGPHTVGKGGAWILLDSIAILQMLGRWMILLPACWMAPEMLLLLLAAAEHAACGPETSAAFAAALRIGRCTGNILLSLLLK